MQEVDRTAFTKKPGFFLCKRTQSRLALGPFWFPLLTVGSPKRFGGLCYRVTSLDLDTFMNTPRDTTVVRDRMVARAAAMPSLPRETKV